MSLGELQDGGLYVMLFLRQPEYAPDDFHWALYLHHNSYTGGTKYHVKTQGSGWIAEHGVTKGILKENFLVGLFLLGNVANELEERTKALVTEEDGLLNTIPGTTCRVWLMRALARVQASGSLRCPDLVALEREIKDWGNSHQKSALLAKKPRPLGVSSLCGPL